MSEKLSAKQYAEQLLYQPEYAADKQPDVKEKAAAFAEGYKNFLDHAKTEREAAATSEQMLLAAGYKPVIFADARQKFFRWHIGFYVYIKMFAQQGHAFFAYIIAYKYSHHSFLRLFVFCLVFFHKIC